MQKEWCLVGRQSEGVKSGIHSNKPFRLARFKATFYAEILASEMFE